MDPDDDELDQIIEQQKEEQKAYETRIFLLIGLLMFSALALLSIHGRRYGYPEPARIITYAPGGTTKNTYKLPPSAYSKMHNWQWGVDTNEYIGSPIRKKNHNGNEL